MEIKSHDSIAEYINNLSEKEFIDVMWNARNVNLLKVRNNLTYNICYVATNINEKSTIFFDNVSEEIWIKLINEKPHLFEYCENQTEKLCLSAVKRWGYLLKYCKFKTDEIIREAVSCCGDALEYCENQTEELCLLAIKSSVLKNTSSPLRFCKFKTDEILKLSLSNCGYNIKYVENPSNELILLAINRDPEVIGYFKGKQTEEMQMTFLNSEHLYNIEKEMQHLDKLSDKIVYEFVKKYPQTIRFFKQTEELQLLAVSKKGSSLGYCSPNIITLNVILTAIRRNKNSIEYVKNFDLRKSEIEEIAIECVKDGIIDILKSKLFDSFSDEFYIKLVEINGLVLEFIKYKFKENNRINIFKCALKQNGLALQYCIGYLHNFDIPIIDELILIAIKQNGLALKFIKNQTEQMCIEAVKQNGLALQYCEIQTKEICDIALKQNISSFAYCVFPEN